MESWSFSFSFDIARRHAKYREHDYLYATANGVVGGNENMHINNAKAVYLYVADEPKTKTNFIII